MLGRGVNFRGGPGRIHAARVAGSVASVYDIGMSKQVEFFFDVVSPASYFAFTRLPGLTERTGAEVVYVPMLLGGLLKATGNRPPATVPNKGKWMFADLKRFSARDNIPFKFNPFFPMNTVPLMRVACALQNDQPERFVEFCTAAFDAAWVNPVDLSDTAQLAALLTAKGFDAEAIAARIAEPEVKEMLKNNTDRAVEKGLFGAPSFIVGDELHWGQDRMDFVEAALTR